MATLGIPYFLEDKTGVLNGSDFVDVNDRMHLSLRCTLRDSTRTAYMIYDLSPGGRGYPYPAATLDYGPNNALGTVIVSGRPAVPMSQYLTKVSAFGSSKHRKFIASDGQEYQWNYRAKEGFEWTCLNTSGYLVAYYNLRIPGEPQYPGSSGCSFTVDEGYPHLAVELLASLLIMRHIHQNHV